MVAAGLELWKQLLKPLAQTEALNIHRSVARVERAFVCGCKQRHGMEPFGKRDCEQRLLVLELRRREHDGARHQHLINAFLHALLLLLRPVVAGPVVVPFEVLRHVASINGVHGATGSRSTVAIWEKDRELARGLPSDGRSKKPAVLGPNKS